jgi:hypothetical protein
MLLLYLYLEYQSTVLQALPHNNLAPWVIFFLSFHEAYLLLFCNWSSSCENINILPKFSRDLKDANFCLSFTLGLFCAGSWIFQSCFAELFLKSFEILPRCFHNAIKWSNPNLLGLYSQFLAPDNEGTGCKWLSHFGFQRPVIQWIQSFIE